jgi:hypothetical protein
MMVAIADVVITNFQALSQSDSVSFKKSVVYSTSRYHIV